MQQILILFLNTDNIIGSKRDVLTVNVDQTGNIHYKSFV